MGCVALKQVHVFLGFFLSVQQETAMTSFQPATVSTSEEELISGFVASNLGKLFNRFFVNAFFSSKLKGYFEHLYKLV